jgi:hypothetical protein
LPQYLTALIKKKYGIGGRAKKLGVAESRYE